MQLNPLPSSGTPIDLTQVWKLTGAAIAGLGLGTLLSPEPMAIPVMGTVPGMVVGAIGLLFGGSLYRLAPDSGGCGCGSDCSC